MLAAIGLRSQIREKPQQPSLVNARSEDLLALADSASLVVVLQGFPYLEQRSNAFSK
jgi:hypothetical protein